MLFDLRVVLQRVNQGRVRRLRRNDEHKEAGATQGNIGGNILAQAEPWEVRVANGMAELAIELSSGRSELVHVLRLELGVRAFC